MYVHCIHAVVNCGVPLSLGYGTDVAYNDTVDGSVAVYTCINTEHELHGQDTITCWPNGTWNYSPTGCRGTYIPDTYLPVFHIFL